MANSYDSLAKSLQEIISNRDSRKPVPYDTDGVVTRVEENTAWVKIAGSSIPETPIDRTIDAKTGDAVKVRFDNGRAWITGNSTAPPTDDTLAQAADTKAVSAYIAAGIAQESALIAVDSARKAQEAADSAIQDAEIARTSAIEAKQDATTANNAATDALFQLSEVENVLDTINWITEHGYYQVTEDTSVVNYKVYYTLTGVVVTNPTGSPKTNKYYELVNGKYVMSTDTTVDSAKTYYQVVQAPIQHPEGNPSTQGYYELMIDQSLEQYVSMHLAVTDRGLWIIPDGNPDSAVTKVLVSASGPDAGVTIFGTSGQPLAKYGSSTLIGDPSYSNIKISDEKVAFCQGNDEVAYVTGQELYITRTVVLDRMQLNTKWVWQYDDSDQSIFLKWIG